MEDTELHSANGEYLTNCRRCAGEVKMIREGTIGNLQSDITQCSCIVIEHANSLEWMGNTLTFGHNQVINSSNNQHK